MNMEKLEIILPNSWKGVTLDKYSKLMEIKEGTDLKKMIKYIAVLSDISEADLMRVNVKEFNKINLDWVYGAFDKDIDKTLEIDNIKYGVVKDIKNISIAEYVDLDEYTKASEKNMHKIAAILMRKIVKEDELGYEIEEYDYNTLEARADIFKHKMNVQQLINMLSFFFNLEGLFIKNMNPSLILQK